MFNFINCSSWGRAIDVVIIMLMRLYTHSLFTRSSPFARRELERKQSIEEENTEKKKKYENENCSAPLELFVQWLVTLCLMIFRSNIFLICEELSFFFLSSVRSFLVELTNNTLRKLFSWLVNNQEEGRINLTNFDVLFLFEDDLLITTSAFKNNQYLLVKHFDGKGSLERAKFFLKLITEWTKATHHVDYWLMLLLHRACSFVYSVEIIRKANKGKVSLDDKLVEATAKYWSADWATR